MKIFVTAALLACLYIVESSADNGNNNNNKKTKIGIDQRVVCNIKKSCEECLRMVHCSWCLSDEKCFSNSLEPGKCENETKYTDYGFSLRENANCSCKVTSAEREQEECYPKGVNVFAEKPCSGRGKCVCGRCICDTYTNSTKMVMGDYCEFDNFSCDGPGCNEGPYSLTQSKHEEPEK